jgi:hypothetical protein
MQRPRAIRSSRAAVLAGLGLAGLAGLLAGCAAPPGGAAAGEDPAQFLHWRCEALHDEADRVQRRAVAVAYAGDLGGRRGVIAAGRAVELFWPALRAMHTEGADAAELARLERRHAALGVAAAQLGCAPPAVVDGALLRPMLPLAPGDRLVYEERGGARRAATELALTLDTVRRGRLEFSATLGGQPLPGDWLQDAAGNLLASPAWAAAPGLLYWSRLLEAAPALGAVVAGELRHTGGGRARVRGQVIALGVQTAHGRAFDYAAFELFGEVLGATPAARVDGVLVVDRGSGVLLRLDLRSSDPAFDLRRTLVRVDPGY